MIELKIYYDGSRVTLSYQASKNIIILRGTNNLFQDSPEDIADGSIEIAQTFQYSYNSINIAIGGILPHDAS